jgi:acylphosphatase
MEKRVRATYEGWVQGVGFRFSAERAALSLGLKGWVRNLPDGGVEVVCEGGEEELKKFLEKIGSIFKTYIRSADIDWGAAEGGLEGFEIRF